MVHVFNGILFGHEKDQNLTIVATCLDLEGIVLNEISPTV